MVGVSVLFFALTGEEGKGNQQELPDLGGFPQLVGHICSVFARFRSPGKCSARRY